jgi:selenocysteine lyase/cysteine desulfurase
MVKMVRRGGRSWQYFASGDSKGAETWKLTVPTLLEATVRPSFAFYNTFDEIDVFINAVRRIAEGGAAV